MVQCRQVRKVFFVDVEFRILIEDMFEEVGMARSYSLVESLIDLVNPVGICDSGASRK